MSLFGENEFPTQAKECWKKGLSNSSVEVINVSGNLMVCNL